LTKIYAGVTPGAIFGGYEMIDVYEEIIIGRDVRGNSIYMTDFRKSFSVLKRCKKLTPAGRELIKQNKFYRNNERRFNDEDLLKIRGVY